MVKVAEVGIDTAQGGFVNSWEEADSLLETMNFPIIIRPSFTMGGTGGSVAYNYDEFQKLGVNIYSVSTDTHWTHKAWHKSSDVVSKVQYTMISDDQFKLSKQFKVLRKGEGRSDRGTFIVDPNGIIQAYEITAEGIGRDAKDLLRKVKAAQYVHNNPDEVCPAKWQEGEATLTPSLDLSGKI